MVKYNTMEKASRKIAATNQAPHSSPVWGWFWLWASVLKAHTGQTGRLHGELSVHYRQDFLLFLRGNADAFQCLPNATVRANGRLVVRSGKCRNTGVGFSAKWAYRRNWLICFHGGTPPVRWCPWLSAGVSGQSRTGGIRPHRCGWCSIIKLDTLTSKE